MRSAFVLICAVAPSAAFTLPRGSAGRTGAVRLAESSKTTAGGAGMDTDEASEYEYNEADFADYASDYSDVDGGALEGDADIDASILDLYDDYEDIGGYDLTPFEKHAREVFLTYAEQVQSVVDHESGDLSSSVNDECEDTQLENAAILKKDLYSMLQALDIDATEDESKSLWKYLDVDGDGRITLDEVSYILLSC